MNLPSLSQATQPDLVDGSFCVGFVNGFTGNLGSNSHAVCTDGASMGTVVRAYVTFMGNNPKLFDEDRRMGLRLALQQAYPCPASQGPQGQEPRLKNPSSMDAKLI